MLDLAFYFGLVVTNESLVYFCILYKHANRFNYMAFWFNGTVKISREQNQSVCYVIFVSQVHAILLFNDVGILL